MDSLDCSRGILPAACITELPVPADVRLFTGKRGVPPGTRRGVQIGLHMCPAMTLDLEDPAAHPFIDSSFCGDIILVSAELVYEVLLKRRNDAVSLLIDKSRTDIQDDDGVILLEWFN